MKKEKRKKKKSEWEKKNIVASDYH